MNGPPTPICPPPKLVAIPQRITALNICSFAQETKSALRVFPGARSGRLWTTSSFTPSRNQLDLPLRRAALVVLNEFSLRSRQRVIQRLDKRIRVHEITRPLLPPLKHFLLLHLLQGLTPSKRLLHHRRSFLQHLGELTHIIQIRQRPVSRDHLNIRRQLR